MTDPREEQIVKDIGEYGWSGIIVEKDEEGPGFEYTVGLMLTYDHPEVIIFGLPSRAMHDILWSIVSDIHEGRDFREPGLYEDITEHFACAFRAVHPSWHTEYLGYAMWHRREVGSNGVLEVMQCVWPDERGRFPFDTGCMAAVVREQPILQSARPVL